MNERRRRPSRPSKARPPQRKANPRPVDVDPVRLVAVETLRAVRERDAYANLALPPLLKQRRITGRDAALATELTYGACRAQGLLDAVIGDCSTRPLSEMDPKLLDALRVGVYQILRTRIPAHAAVASTVDIVRFENGSKLSGFANAVLRRAAELDEQEWVDKLAPDRSKDPVGYLAMKHAHPKWIAQAFADALGLDELEDALAADDARPAVHLTARPGEISADELAAITGGDPAPYSPYGVRLEAGAGDPGDLEPVQEGFAVVQDEGSQLVSLAVTKPEVDGSDLRWLDLCAGPGGKAGLLGALVTLDGGALDAVEQAPHRADLVRKTTEGLSVTVHTADGRSPGLESGFDRVLVDAPCTGLGALRRRPEARWRRQPGDVGELTKLQRELLTSAIELTRPGGIVGYVVCSPHLPETEGVVADVVRRTGVTQLDAREHFPDVPDLGDGPGVQLWPHKHGTDAMFCALFRV
ncbi:RsmB/NOP family class I SAM-dependent RNA methyltransferase [Saccharopolyspora mangrovi]|uniref:RsmB/NOP family class I SAM-dependent RNA methyltransferase n=1 Tax=Saccharopolyspora mangrovi TaxID=3082379 RepID=A0ABU6A7J8_9PSEU|nr:RsmB/NOP family class I SAM-dependent RNA methyltransferase [Saccharopolyspora sp. S2-29]MEB3367510.1 RsmB/NOP family class I SAM-dependent RNA methyltransferase [Saccharopolyspora sp. S2-29]